MIAILNGRINELEEKNHNFVPEGSMTPVFPRNKVSVLKKRCNNNEEILTIFEEIALPASSPVNKKQRVIDDNDQQ